MIDQEYIGKLAKKIDKALSISEGCGTVDQTPHLLRALIYQFAIVSELLSERAPHIEFLD